MSPLFAAASAEIYWHLPILLVVFSLIYSATRHDRWDRILWETAGWIIRVAGFLVGIAAALYVLSTYPDYWPYLAGAGAVVGIFVMYILPALLHKPKPEAAPAATPPPTTATSK